MKINIDIKTIEGIIIDLQNGDKEHVIDYFDQLIVGHAFHEHAAKQAWIMTYSGKHLHAFDPRPEQICLEDIAHSLSKNNRFTNHCKLDYTVGQHSLHVYDLLRRFGESTETCLIGLLHDASEAYLQDIAKPFKQFLPDYQEVEELLQNAIYLKYLGFVPTKDQYSIVKMVDEILLVNEIEKLMPQDEDWFIPDVPKIDVMLTPLMPKDLVYRGIIDIAKELGARD